ncbi:MAG: hypothetical protein AB2L24_22040 [Mangrovibacterium sp.]
MRRLLNIIAAFQILILSWFSTGIYGNTFIAIKNIYSHEQSSSTGRNPLSFGVNHSYNHFVKSEDLNHSLNKISSSVRLNYHSLFPVKKKVTALFFANAYSRYVCSATSIVHRLKPPEMVFPFSYFW